jgi:hypothetical protein
LYNRYALPSLWSLSQIARFFGERAAIAFNYRHHVGRDESLRMSDVLFGFVEMLLQSIAAVTVSNPVPLPASPLAHSGKAGGSKR